MSESKKNAFSEKTIVQTRPSFGASSDQSDDHSGESSRSPQGSEKTVVFAQSNLKETFDARTVVRSSKPALQPTIKMSLPVDEAPMLPPVELQNPTFGIENDSALIGRDTDKILPAKKNLTQDERRAERQALDRKKSRMIAAFAIFCAVIILALVMAFGGPKSNEQVAATSLEKSSVSQTTDLASETPAASKKPPGPDDFLTTTDVLAKFDRAAQRSQEHALDYSKSSSGF